MRWLLLLVLVGCDAPEDMPGGACSTADQMVCGKASGGSTVALVCTPGVAAGPTWSYVTNCDQCDHVVDCKTEVECNGTNIANEGLHCDVQNSAACGVTNTFHVLVCDSTNTWTTVTDCSNMGMTCGKVPGTSNHIGCI